MADNGIERGIYYDTVCINSRFTDGSDAGMKLCREEMKKNHRRSVVASGSSGSFKGRCRLR
jgi:hypothetical protein